MWICYKRIRCIRVWLCSDVITKWRLLFSSALRRTRCMMRTGSCWTTARTCVTAWTCPVRAATSLAPNVAPKSVALSVDVAGSGSTNMWKLKGQIWYWNGRSLKIRTSGDVHKALNLKSKWQLEGRKESWRSLKWLTNWRSVERNFIYRGVQESL